MFKYSKDGISVLSVLDARRAKKSGLFPVKIQVIHNRIFCPNAMPISIYHICINTIDAGTL